MRDRLRIVVTGLIAQHPALGGMTWHYLQYVVGLQRLGHDVYYLEDSGEWPYNWDGGPSGDDWVERDPAATVAHLASVMANYGMEERWSYRFAVDGRWFGMTDHRRQAVVASADVLLNVSGSVDDPSLYRDASCLAMIDSDPIFTQLELLREPQGLRARRTGAHDVHFSFGQRFDGLQTAPYSWIPTRQPIVLSEWDSPPPPRPVYTTVMNWTSYASVTHGGVVYGQKDRELVRFLDLPQRAPGVEFEIALPELGHAEWATALLDDLPVAVAERLGAEPMLGADQLLRLAGWRPIDALDACGDYSRYHRYVSRSKAEWTVAKNGYVQGRSGWFSERSACYLAAGRPVITQDTGYEGVLPTGEGLIAFSTAEQAAVAVEEVEARYDFHAAAAREMAHEYFDATRVLKDLLEALEPRRQRDGAVRLSPLGG